MKTLKIVLLAFLVTASVSAQDLMKSEVPQALTEKFQKEYPNGNDVEWEKEMDIYKVEFEIDRQDYEIWYAVSGEMVKMEKDLNSSELPAAVSNAIKTNYKDFRIDDCEEQQIDGKTSYKVELEKGSEDFDVRYDKAGKVLDKRSEKD